MHDSRAADTALPHEIACLGENVAATPSWATHYQIANNRTGLPQYMKLLLTQSFCLCHLLDQLMSICS